MNSLKILFLVCVSAGLLRAQNITNTLGSLGLFKIKDNSTTFLSLNQQNGQLDITGNINLPHSFSSSAGSIMKNGLPFIHNYTAPGTNGYNTFMGINSGNFTMSGTSSQASYNTAFGYYTLNGLTTGNQNTALGYAALLSNSAGQFNTAIGCFSLFQNTTGYGNTATGDYSLLLNTTGFGNSAFGYLSMKNNTIGSINTAFGESVLMNNDGSYNTGVGFDALVSNTSGGSNTALGSLALYSNTTGHDNVSAGDNTLYSNSTGSFNTAVGTNALNSNKADNNTGIGEYSLYNNSTGIKNTGIGGLSGYNTGSGSNVTCIGYNSNPSSTTVNNQITLGDNTITSLRCNTTTITSLSDARDKKNIRDLTLGIDFIMKLRPRLYNWDKREWYENNISDGSKMNETPSAGFIAQELDTVQTTENAEYLNLVLKDNPEKIEATPGNLLPIVVKALQDLRTENVELKSELELLKTQMAEIKNEFSLHAPKNTTNGNSVVNK